MAFELHLEHYQIHERSFSLFEPDKEAIATSYQKGEIDFPYWSQVWPAAIGLAQFVVQHPEYIIGKKVLELAAGLGLPSLVAAAYGASMVTASDYMPDAVVSIQQTIAYNRFTNMQAQILDWRTLPVDLFTEVLLLSDVSYDEPLFALQEEIIRRFLHNGTTVIISTPQRLVAKQAVQPLLAFCIHQAEIEVEYKQQTVAVSLLILQL